MDPLLQFFSSASEPTHLLLLFLQVLSMILDNGVPPDVVNRHKQTPLMLAAMHGKIDCVLRLLQAGANVSKASNSLPSWFRRLQDSLANHEFDLCIRS
jgi:ankyrin repeat protein